MSHLKDSVINEEPISEEDARNSETTFEASLSNLHEHCGEASEKRTRNGDMYVGSCKSGLPDGFGKYLWSDGCMYEGDWVCGKATGRGKMSWPSDTTYDGELSGGVIHGVGTFTGYGNIIYKGSWVMNVEHGLGRKWYPNGDVYEGLWKQGMQDGPGKYSWKNGNVYFGDWRRGKFSGKGKLTWASKDSYDGEWDNGLQHGRGTYTWADGCVYTGTWSRGKKDGKGTFYPPGTLPVRNLSSGSSHSIKSSNMIASPGIPSVQQRLGKIVPSVKRLESLTSWRIRAETMWSLKGRVNFSGANEEARSNVEAGTSGNIYDHLELAIVEREYAQGVLIGELAKDSLQSALTRSGISLQRYLTQKPRKAGETIVKGHRSYDLMLNLQLGISYSIGRSSKALDSELLLSDFNPRAKDQIFFPGKGSQKTTPNQSVGFRWTDYCPKVFRRIRQIFKINQVDYLMSLCGSDALRELSSPGKSGSVFYLSNDDCYMIKTLRKSEMKVLFKMLQTYYGHICKHPNTFITKFFGIHQVMPEGGKKIQVVVMGNIFCTELRIHRKFDLKGSSQGRSSKNIEIDETTTLKDLDLNFNFLLEPSWRLAIFEQMHEDCDFLESEHIMDYSLLLGVHFRAPGVSELSVSSPSEASKLAQDQKHLEIIREASLPETLALVAHNEEDSIQGTHVRGRPLKAETVGHQEVDLMILDTNSRLQVQLGVNMPALAFCRRPKAGADRSIDELYDVKICFGIIDILQKYGLAKRIEHAHKTLKYGSSSVSAVNPHLYSHRFREFIQRIFLTRS